MFWSIDHRKPVHPFRTVDVLEQSRGIGRPEAGLCRRAFAAEHRLRNGVFHRLEKAIHVDWFVEEVNGSFPKGIPDNCPFVFSGRQDHG